MAKKEEAAMPEIDMDAINARIDKMLADAQAKADAIIAAAGGKAAPEADPVAAAERAAENARMEEYVNIQLFKDNRYYKDDLYVSVNGENCLIQRGVPTKVKRKFALVIEQAERQHNRTMALIDGLVEKADRRLREIN